MGRAALSVVRLLRKADGRFRHASAPARRAWSGRIPVNCRSDGGRFWCRVARRRCTGCSTCAQACPDGCILVETEPKADGQLNIKRYEIDFRLCMYCGLCTEACPYEAIQVGGILADASYNFADLYRDKHALTELAQQHLRNHDNVYPNGMTAPERD